MNKPDNPAVVEQLLNVTSRESRYLSRTCARLQSQNVDIIWVRSLDENDEYSEMLDAFVSRFSRLQDTLGDKLIPALLRANLEKTGSQLDNILRAEKLGWIDSAESWIELRELRNRMIHEYMETPEDLFEALQQALRGAETLVDTQKRMTAVAASLR